MKILIIDDSNFSRMLTERQLMALEPDSEIIFAIGGAEGIALFDKLSPDFVITDLLMPDVTGESVVKHVKSKNPHCFICVLSANVQKQIQRELKELGADLFLEKPITPEKAQTLMECYRQKKP